MKFFLRIAGCVVLLYVTIWVGVNHLGMLKIADASSGVDLFKCMLSWVLLSIAIDITNKIKGIT